MVLSRGECCTILEVGAASCSRSAADIAVVAGTDGGVGAGGMQSLQSGWGWRWMIKWTGGLEARGEGSGGISGNTTDRGRGELVDRPRYIRSQSGCVGERERRSFESVIFQAGSGEAGGLLVPIATFCSVKFIPAIEFN